MKKYREIIRKCENNCGIYETGKYRYAVVYGMHTELLRIERSKLDTTAAADGWKLIYKS